jgi:hypothetical protein
VIVVYQFALPIMSNDGTVDYTNALHAWEQAALIEAGGYTDLGIRHGVWRDDATGKTFAENMQGYQIAVDEDGQPFARQHLLDEAQRLFPDQLAFYVAKIGTAEIEYRRPM